MTTTAAPIHSIEAEHRVTKAACLAKRAIRAGLSAEILYLLDNPTFRETLLQTTERPANRRGYQRWTEASEQTWAEVKAIVRVFAA